MKIFGYQLKRSARSAAKASDDDDHWFGNFMSRLGASGVRVTPDLARQIVAVFSCIRVRAETMGTLPIFLYKRSGDNSRDRDEKHNLAKLLRRPNPWQSWQDFCEMMCWHLDLRGNAYARIDMRKNGNPGRLIPLNPDKITPKLDGQQELYYEYRTDMGGVQIYSPDEILHLKQLSEDGISGQSVVMAQSNFLGEVLAADTFSHSLFKNMAQPSGVLKHPGKFRDKKAQDRVINSWRKAYAGPQNAGKVAILEDGLDWVKLGMSAVDVQLLEQKRFSNQQICAMFRVPPHKIGDLSQAKYANIETQNIEAITDMLLPIATRWEAELPFKLLSETEQEKYFVEFLFDGLLRGDRKARSEALQIQRQNGVINTNEWRRIENMNPVEDTEVGEAYLVNGAMVSIKSAIAGTAKVAAPAPAREQKAALPKTDSTYRSLFEEIIYQLLTKQSNAIRSASKKKDFGAWVKDFLPENRAFIAQKLRSAARGFLDIAAFELRWNGEKSIDDEQYRPVLDKILPEFAHRFDEIGELDDDRQQEWSDDLTRELMKTIRAAAVPPKESISKTESGDYDGERHAK